MKQIMKIIISIAIIINLGFLNILNTKAVQIIQVPKNIDINKEIILEDLFYYTWKYFIQWLAKSYKYIDLKYKNIDESDRVYDSLQKLVYIDVIENKNINLKLDAKVSLYNFYKFNSKVFWLDLKQLNNIDKNSKELATVKDFIYMSAFIVNYDNQEKENSENAIDQKQLEIFFDVYNTLITNHYSKDKLDSKEMLYDAIEWLTKQTDDKFTNFLRPIEKKNFNESMSWEYEWIWSYVDMETPWVFKIVSPLSGSPSEKVWIKWWDIVIEVDDKKITKETSLEEAISWVKWPAWTTVKLKIKRWKDIMTFDVVREKIELKSVSSKIYEDKNAFYIKLSIFWEKTYKEFLEEIENLEKEDKINKLIIDLRNNPGWYLSEVVDMLGIFIEKWENVAVVSGLEWKKYYKSKWKNKKDFSKYEIIILANSGTASASEILAWTLKDYYDNVVIIWTKTYGKWSVQELKSYTDWSSLKYTIAKWFTGKTETWIDHIWISPDIELELDIEKFKKWIDNQLEEALKFKILP